MATLQYAENVHRLRLGGIPTPYSCVGQELESESVPESVSGNVNEPLYLVTDMTFMYSYFEKQ